MTDQQSLVMVCAFCPRYFDESEQWRFTKDGRVACGSCKSKAWAKKLVVSVEEHALLLKAQRSA